MQQIDRAVADWRAVLGTTAVSTDAQVLAAYQMNTSEYRPRELIALLRPSAPDDVRHIIDVARSTGVPLYPLSTGRNWGFGSALPPRGPVALVDLGRMNRVIEVNTQYRYAVFEPGTTQGQLADHLTGLGCALKLNVTGAGRETSIVGNVLDHGGGHLGARFDDLLGVEVALGNGEVVRTGLWHLRESGDMIQHYPPGLGPDLRGLFVQSSFGIVTKMVLRLHPARPFRELTLEAAEARLPAVVDALRQAREDSVINGYVRLTDGMDPHIRFFRRGTGATWKAQITLYGTSALRAEAGREMRRRTSALVHRTDCFDTEHDDLRARDGEDRALLEARLRLAHGAPSDRSLENIARSAGKSFPPGTAGLDHDRELPGFLCANVTLPFSGAHVAACVAEVRAAADEAGITAACLFGMIGPTALSGFFPFYFDRRSPGAVSRAHALRDELHRRLEARGIYPMRLDVDSAGPFIERTDDGFWRTVSALKRALDPDDVIAGRYTPPPRTRAGRPVTHDTGRAP
ncbi:FAD-binding oxidoreductase [Streptomyces sp. NPDC004232]|uniref:FAD-binding oxidoreductase n=1 Tax=Streptomyces sp. NPDC004232 TaxID=3154454 RepID=UPI001D55511D|nr:FAD-binding oxidoreductase [Streptomyces sp. tea 10]